MKVLHIGKKGNMERFSAPGSYLEQLESIDMYMSDVQEYLAAAADADFIVADAIAPVPAELIGNMPNLKLIHSEGVAYNQIDTAAADRCGVYVCNSQGMNSSAVAEQTVLLMIGLLRDIRGGDEAVRRGMQITKKEGYMLRGDLRELADCRIGLVGFGDIARKTAELLRAFGVSSVSYYKRTPLSPGEEESLGVCYQPLDKLLGTSDIVSLHLPLTSETEAMAGSGFFASMKADSYFVNTSRGGLVDDQALGEALVSGHLAGAALDTVNGEPVSEDHPLLHLPDGASDKILFSPHIAGITASSFRRSYAMIAEDIRAAAEGRIPERVVNHPETGEK